MISPSFLKNQFMDTFGSVAYVLEFCGIYFSCFLFGKLIVYLIVMILRHMEINRLTGASLGFGKTLLSASYNLFLTSILSSVFNPQAPLCKRWNLNQCLQEVKTRLEIRQTEIGKRKSTFIQLFTAPLRLFPQFD